MAHIDYLKNVFTSSEDETLHPMVQTAIGYLDSFDAAITKLISDGDYEEYVSSITEFDKFLWECGHNFPQKTNPINILQNKKYSSYRETLLLGLWIRIKNQLPFDTVLVLNRAVVQTIYSDGTYAYKDVDGGLGILCGENILPVIVDEDKSGHFCKTSAKNVNGIFKCFEDLNPNVIRVCTTDNKVSIGKSIDAEDLPSFNIIASLRKENGNSGVYQELNPKIFEQLETKMLANIKQKGAEAFSCDKYKIKNKQNKSIRASIDECGLYENL